MGAEDKNVNIDGIKEHLISDEGPEKIVVLFDNSVSKNKNSKSIGEMVKDDYRVTINKNEPFVIQNNMLVLGKKKVILGLKDDEKYLIGHYPEDIIRYYTEE